MSNLVFPTLIGVMPNVGRMPIFRTRIQAGVSGDEFRLAYQAYPLWSFKLQFEFLRDDAANNELNKILALFMAVRGSWDNFLYTDPDRNSVTDWQFGICDSVLTQFQLTRPTTDGSISFVEPVQNVNALTNIKRAGVTLTNPGDYTVSATGLVSFTSPGTNGQALTWTGTYYNRCRFEMDMAEVQRFMDKLWQLKTCDLRGAPGNKV
jgi:hypothetical protein